MCVFVTAFARHKHTPPLLVDCYEKYLILEGYSMQDLLDRLTLAARTTKDLLEHL